MAAVLTPRRDNQRGIDGGILKKIIVIFANRFCYKFHRLWIGRAIGKKIRDAHGGIAPCFGKLHAFANRIIVSHFVRRGRVKTNEIHVAIRFSCVSE